MDAGHGQVEGGLLVGLQPEVGKVEGVRVDAVPELLVPADRLGQDRHAFFAEQPLVPLERLAPGVVARRVPRHLAGDLVERARALGVQQDEHQVGQPFQPVEGSHGGQRRARPDR